VILALHAIHSYRFHSVEKTSTWGENYSMTTVDTSRGFGRVLLPADRGDAALPLMAKGVLVQQSGHRDRP